MTELNTDEIPVVRSEDPTRLVGFRNRRDLVAAYTAQIEALKAPDGSAGRGTINLVR